MSRSKRKPIYKDKGYMRHDYWSKIRHEWKQDLNQNYHKDDFNLRNPKSIINDYDWCDYIFYIELSPCDKKGLFWSDGYGWTKEQVEYYSRK